MNQKEKNRLIFFDRLKLWLFYIRKNWKIHVVKFLLYLFPIFITHPIISSYISGNFIFLLLVLVVGFLFLLNEAMHFECMEKIKKLEGEKKSLKDKNDKLIEASGNLSYYLSESPREFLKNVSKSICLKNSERISLYVVYKDEFQIIGRYSENPIYDRICRERYPLNCGYISKCLKNNNGKSFYYREDLPTKEMSYIELVSKETEMDEYAIRGLTMKSRAYFTRLIKDENRYNKNIGVLVIESTNKKLPIKPKDLNIKLEELIIPHISTFLDIVNKLRGRDSNDK